MPPSPLKNFFCKQDFVEAQTKLDRPALVSQYKQTQDKLDAIDAQRDALDNSKEIVQIGDENITHLRNVHMLITCETAVSKALKAMNASEAPAFKPVDVADVASGAAQVSAVSAA